jgi:DNA-binding PadR family transcriptional regulator
MSIKHGLLALLERGPMHGYQLRAAFEESTGGTWPLNIGQVYTTLSRLERDGLVRPLPQGDELAIKLALALTTPGVDVRAVVQAQRGATMGTLQEYTRLKARADQPADLAWRLVLDAMLFQAEAEVRWLDHCEASLVRYSPPPVRVPQAAPDTATEASRQ